MRLWFSVMAMLYLMCIILEASAAKSNRNMVASKSNNYKSINSKEIRYTKNEADHKKKGNAKEEELAKERKQHHQVEGNQNFDSKKILKSNKNKGDEKMTYGKQRRQKFNKQSKVTQSGENFKIDKNIFEVTKDKVKKHKRSIEFEQSQKNPLNDAVDSLSKFEDNKLDSRLKEQKSKNVFDKKTGNGIGRAVDDQCEGDGVVYTKQVSGNRASEKTDSLKVDKKVKSSKKKMIGDEEEKNLEEKREQKHHCKCEELRIKNVNPKNRELMEEENQILERQIEFGIKNSKELNFSSENRYYSNEDGLIKEKNAESTNIKKCQSSKKSFGTALECDYSVCDCKLAIASDKLKYNIEKSGKPESGICNLEVEYIKKQDRTHIEKSNYLAENIKGSSIEDIEQQEIEGGASLDLDTRIIEKSDVQDDIVEDKNCAKKE